MGKIKGLYKRHKELILYFVFGVATTVVNLVTYYCLGLAGGSYLIHNVIAWLVAVLFAYVTNKLFVFRSRSWKIGILAKELPEFFGARVFSLAVEEAGLWLLVDLLNWNRFSFPVMGFRFTGELLAKMLLAVVVVVLNYFFSKFVIFKKKQNSDC